MKHQSESRGLLVVQVDLRHSPLPGAAVLTLFIGEEEVGSIEIALTRTDVEPRSRRAPEMLVQPDQSTNDVIAALLSSIQDRDDPLWIRFGRSAGPLTSLRWERWIQPVVKRTVLRLPHHLIKPANLDGGSEFALCASMPRAKAPFPVGTLLRKTIEPVLASMDARFHVFVDRAQLHEARSELQPHIDNNKVVIYSPDDAEQFGTAKRSRELESSHSAVTNPWLLWMLHALKGQSLDLVIFLCHGYYADRHGALSFAESPLVDRDARWARFVAAGQLVTFLDHAGASGVALASPPRNHSMTGSTALVDEIQRKRPGPAMLVDVSELAGGGILGGALQFLFAQDPQALPLSADLTLYCHPDLLLTEPPEEEIDEPDLETFTLVRRRGKRSPRTRVSVQPQLDSAPVPAPKWASPSQRILERQMYHIESKGSAAGRSDSYKASQSGASNALRFVADLLKKSLEGGER